MSLRAYIDRARPHPVQDNFLFASANCHSKNRDGSVASGCFRTTAARGRAVLSDTAGLAVRGDFAPSVVETVACTPETEGWYR